MDIDVKINGRKKSLKYQVEIIDFAEIEPENDDKVSVLKKVIKEHDKDWELIQIGAPITNNIPIMFRKRGE